MKLEILNSAGEIIHKHIIRSDFIHLNHVCDDSDVNYIVDLIKRYAVFDKGFTIMVNGDTLPLDPNFKEKDNNG